MLTDLGFPGVLLVDRPWLVVIMTWTPLCKRTYGRKERMVGDSHIEMEFLEGLRRMHPAGKVEGCNFLPSQSVPDGVLL